MRPTTFQHAELRDENDEIIQQGTYGKGSALSNSTNDGWIDYVMNNLEALNNNATPLDSPAFTGTPTAPTPPSDEDSTQIATTEFVQGKIAESDDYTDGKIAAEVERADEKYLPLSGGTVTGDLTVTGTLDGTASGNLPLSGGTMTGSIQYVDNGKVFAIGHTEAGNVDLGWSWDNREGAGIGLRSVDHTSPGEFTLFARDANNDCSLKGKPDGSLTWNSQPLLPVGIVQAFAGTTIPNGWLLCDGSAVSRTDYAALYAVIGTTYGAGNGSTTFNLPNLVDKFVEGSATAGTVKSAGLPNITGQFSLVNPTGYMACLGLNSGAFNELYANVKKMSGPNAYQDTDRYQGIKFNASASSSIYGNSTTVQPPALTMRYIIKY